VNHAAKRLAAIPETDISFAKSFSTRRRRRRRRRNRRGCHSPMR